MASNEEDPQLENCTKSSRGDDEEDTVGEPEIKSDWEALKMAEKLTGKRSFRWSYLR